MPRHDPDRSQRSPAQRTVDDGPDHPFVGQGDDADGGMALANSGARGYAPVPVSPMSLES